MYIVMELVERVDLATRIGDGRPIELPFASVFSASAPMCSTTLTVEETSVEPPSPAILRHAFRTDQCIIIFGMVCLGSALILRLFLAAPALLAQQESEMTPRQLFYWEGSPPKTENTTSRTEIQKNEASRASAKKSAKTGAVDRQTSAILTGKPSVAPVGPAKVSAVTVNTSGGLGTPTSQRLALRYNVLKVNVETGSTREVDPETIFRSGDCVAVRFMPNRSGFVYVFSQGSSGKWSVLLPSPDAPEENNSVGANRARSVPEGLCFEFDGNPGTERLFIVVTEDAKEVLRLNQALETSADKLLAQSLPPSGRIPTEGLSTKNTGHESLEVLTSQLVSRDLKLQKIRQPASPEEPPNSIYAVDSSSMPTPRLAIEVILRHE